MSLDYLRVNEVRGIYIGASTVKDYRDSSKSLKLNYQIIQHFQY